MRRHCSLLTPLAFTAHIALVGCHSAPYGVPSLGPRVGEVTLRVELERVQAFDEYTSELSEFSLREAHEMGTHPERMQCLVTVVSTVSAPTDEIALAVARWWGEEVASITARKAAPEDVGGSVPCASIGGRLLDEEFDPTATICFNMPDLVNSSADGNSALARMETVIGVECPCETLQVLLLLDPRLSEEDWRSSVWAPRAGASTRAPLRVPPYETWRFESLSPMLRFAPAPTLPSVAEPARLSPLPSR